MPNMRIARATIELMLLFSCSIVRRAQLVWIVIVRRQRCRMRRRWETPDVLHIGAVSVARTVAGTVAVLHVFVEHGKYLAVEYLEATDAIDHALEFLLIAVGIALE